MGLTFQQAKAVGLGHLHPAASGRTEAEVLRHLGVETAPPKSKKSGDGMNKTERAFVEMLWCGVENKTIDWWMREPFKLRLAGRTWYTPDFVVEPIETSRLACVEVKGFMRDDAAVKLKVAAETYPCFRWLLVTRAGRHGWEVREVARTGIGREPIIVPWIGGGG
jgi:hypothetical protein